MSWRNDLWRRLSAMAGLDEHGGILPPSGPLEIDRTPSKWWRTEVVSRGELVPSNKPNPLDGTRLWDNS